jgi:peptidoglycan/xylan/chitin deacetylase (PgdA/CDA1 family)
MGSEMQHNRFDYLPITRRKPLRLPRGERVAVWIVPNIEHYHYDRPAMSLTPMTMQLKPDVLNYAWRDYGVRVGIWRLMEIFERQGFPVTAAINSEVCRYYPQIIESGERLGWEWLAHGVTNSALFTGMGKEEERTIIKGVLDEIAQRTGTHCRGWLGPALTETDNTLDLLAELGIEYVADWCNDELPYRMRTSSGSLVAMPYTLELGDVPIFLNHGATGEDFYQIVVDQFEQLYAEGTKIPRVFCLALHPFLVGHPFRARHLERALAFIKGHKDVWLTTGGQLLDWYRGAGSSD